MYRNILVPVDDSAAAIESVEQAVELAKALGSRIKLVHVINRTPWMPLGVEPVSMENLVGQSCCAGSDVSMYSHRPTSEPRAASQLSCGCARAHRCPKSSSASATAGGISISMAWRVGSWPRGSFTRRESSPLMAVIRSEHTRDDAALRARSARVARAPASRVFPAGDGNRNPGTRRSSRATQLG